MSFVAYRDFNTPVHFEITDFSYDVKMVREKIRKTPCTGGGGDTCEDV